MSSPEQTMAALVTDSQSQSGVRRATVPTPDAAPDEVLLRVAYASLNFLDIAYSADRLPPGSIPGVDSAGTVVAAAEDGSGPPVGTRVVAFGGASWAEYQSVSTELVAAVPDDVDLETAAALPAAGVTAVQIVRALEPVVGRRVLVTGAAGGVGHLVTQLTARAGAEVIALVATPGRGAAIASIAGVEVITDLGDCPPVDGVVELVGGDLLARAFALLARGGRALSVGQASQQPTTIDFEVERNRDGDRWLSPFAIAGPFQQDLDTVLRLCATGVLTVDVGWRGSWDDIDAAVTALRSRQVRGKAVLAIAGG